MLSASPTNCALPETKIGNVEVVDTRGAQWTSAENGDDPLASELHTQPVDLEQAQTPDSHDRVAIFLSLTANPDQAEVHLAFHGPYTMALLVGRNLNTLRTVVYEWDGGTPRRPSYTPALVLEPGVNGGPITEILLAQ